MPTEKEVIKIVGKVVWKKMQESGWLDCITVTINNATCKFKCEKCGRVKNINIKPYDPSIQPNCECGRWKGMHMEKIITAECDIPMSDIDRAYRAATGKYVSPLEWD